MEEIHQCFAVKNAPKMCFNRSRVQIISYFNNNEKFLPGGVEDRGDLIEASGEDILSEADGWRTPWGSVEADGWRGVEEWLLACSALDNNAQLKVHKIENFFGSDFEFVLIHC